MIRKAGSGFIVLAESGKKLGGPYRTREEAERRLRQVEYWKNNGPKKGEGKHGG
jgi:hypothetical protein